MREEVNAWGEPGAQEVLDDLMKEVPIISSTPEQPQVSNQSLAVTMQISPVATPVLSMPSPASIFAMSDPSLGNMQKRLTALKTGPSPTINVSRTDEQGIDLYGTTSEWVLAQGHRKPYPGAPVNIPESSGVTAPDVQPHRIMPIPIPRVQNQSSSPAVVH